MSKHIVTLTELTSDFIVSWEYDDFEQALDKYRKIASERAHHLALLTNGCVCEIKLVSSVNDSPYKTYKTLVQAFEFKH